jgi:glycosyltransferase involved in cell wall biosynthesis
MAALDDLVAEAVPISGALEPRIATAARLASSATRLRPSDLRDPRAGVRRTHAAAQLGRPTIAARWLTMRRRLAAAGPLDGIVQRGCELRLPGHRRVVTFEDSTLLQARAAYPWPHLQGLTEHDFRRYVARQRAAYSAAVACCCSTHWVADSIAGSYGIPAARVFTVGFGPNHEVFEPADRDWERPRFLFVGVDWARKNGSAVLRAFSEVRERHPDARLDVVGGHPAIDEPGVVAHGPLSIAEPADRARLADLFAHATAFVMPSLHEPAGLVYLEAAAAGVASIGTTNGGAATMIGPGGIVVDPHDQDAIVRAMLELCDPERARDLGALAREHSRLFTWRKVAERLLRALAIPGVDGDALAGFL